MWFIYKNFIEASFRGYIFYIRYYVIINNINDQVRSLQELDYSIEFEINVKISVARWKIYKVALYFQYI